MKSFLSYLKYIVCGLVFGVANVIPGVSGGTMLVVFGIYDKLTDSISGIKKILTNIWFLVSFGIGAGGGIILFSFVITGLFDNFGVQTNMFFIGLILGSIPLIIKNGTREEDVKPLCIIPFLLAAAVVIGLTLLEKANIISDIAVTGTDFDLMLMLRLLICSMVAAVAMIIPGVSGSFVMMLLGTYQTVIAAIKDMNIILLIPVAIGVVIGIILGAKVISTLIKKHTLMVYSAIMGLVIGSVYAILPDGFGFNTSTYIGFATLVVGGIIALLMGKYSKDE